MNTHIIILNKNNGTAYTLDENYILTDNYNETLDSVNCRISHITPIDIEVGDYVYLYNTNPNRLTNYYMVESYVLTQDTIGIDNETYSYDITLCSQTKDLEGYLCPNLSITPLRTGTKRSIYYYLDLYNNLYGKKVRQQLLGQIEWTNAWILSANAYAKFTQIDCPEMQWNAPTLREVFNDLMMVADCIPILRNGTIDYIDLTEKKNEITSYNFIQRSQSLEDYASELKMNMQNVLQTGIENIRNTITTSEYLTFKSSDYLVTSENIKLETTYPILKIKHLWMCMFVPFGKDDNQVQLANLVKRDLTDLDGGSYIKEYQEYITQNVAYQVADITGDEWYKWQNYCIYYTRGGKDITGFSDVSKKFIWTTTSTIELLKQRIIANLQPNTEIKINDQNYNNATNSYFSTFFLIEYETMTDQVFQASKKDAKNKRVIVDNQTNSWVDAYNQGNLEYQKANRLANQTILFNQRVDDINNAIKIGDYYIETKDGKTYDIVIYQTQYQVHRDHIEVNAYGTKDYILKNYWTGINSKIRTWVNARDEALIRHELEKYYCGLSFTRHNEIESVANGYDLGKLIGESLIQNDNKAVKFAMLDTRLEGNGYQPDVTLTESTWQFNDEIDFTGIESNISYMFGFLSNETAYFIISIQVDDNGNAVKKINYLDTNANYINVYNNGWVNPAYKTIFFGTGVDVSNEFFIQWLKVNATMTSPNTYVYQTEMVSRIMGDSYVFTTGFNDNYEVGRCVKTNGQYGIERSDIDPLEIDSYLFKEPRITSGTIQTTQGIGGIPTQPLKYTNDNGEFETLNMVAFCDVLDSTSGSSIMDGIQQRDFLMLMFNRPLLYNGTDDSLSHALTKKFKISKDYYKDNKEIFKLSIQFELFSDDQDIMFTRHLLQNNPIIQDNPQIPNLKFYGSFDESASLPSGAFEIIATLTRTSISNVVSEFTLNTLATIPYIYITDNNNNVLMRLTTQNHINESAIKFYLNILKDKDYSYYNILGQKQGEI